MYKVYAVKGVKSGSIPGSRDQYQTTLLKTCVTIDEARHVAHEHITGTQAGAVIQYPPQKQTFFYARASSRAGGAWWRAMSC